MAFADLVTTTLGPKGMDKILQSTGRGQQAVINDGATLLKSLHIDNPAVKVLVDISKVQDDEVGDGTTSVLVLVGELLREADKLVNSNIHPMTMISVYRMAADTARNALLQKVVDNKEDADVMVVKPIKSLSLDECLKQRVFSDCPFLISGSMGDMAMLGISESFKVKQAVLLSATEAAEMILWFD